jgi:thiamine biosynthesis protein ThiI
MAAIEASVDLPVLRPLIGFDKREIVAAARAIGTFDTRSAGHDDCCSYLIPPHPATKATAEELAAVEERLPVERITGEALEEADRTNLAGL